MKIIYQKGSSISHGQLRHQLWYPLTLYVYVLNYCTHKDFMLQVILTLTSGIKINRGHIWALPYMTPITLSRNVTGFMFLSRQGLYAVCQCDLDLNPTDPKINRGRLWIMAN